jgi:hypothetical protein
MGYVLLSAGQAIKARRLLDRGDDIGWEIKVGAKPEEELSSAVDEEGGIGVESEIARSHRFDLVLAGRRLQHAHITGLTKLQEHF